MKAMANAEKPRQTETKVVETASGEIKITHPKGTRRGGVTVLLSSDDVLREQATGFTNFLRDYAVVGLAVGFILGQQANAVVKQLVASFISPWLEVLFGPDLSKHAATVHHGTTAISLPWGAFVYTIIEFFFVAVTIYVVVKLFRLDKLKKVKEKK